MQVCPVAAKMPETTPLTALSISGVLEHDIGRFAAKLERDRLDGPRGKLVDALSGAVAPGEGDLRDMRMGDKALADLGAEAGHDIDDAGRKAGFLEQAAKLERRHRGEFRRLPDDRIACGQSRRELPGGQHQRRIPRRDRRHDPERLFAGEVDHAGLVDRNDPPLDLVREAAEIVEPLRYVAQLRPHFGDQLAVVARLDLRQPIGFGGDQIGELAEKRAPRGRADLGPRRRAERLPRGFHRAVDVRAFGSRNKRPGRAEIRVFSLECLARLGVDPFAADQHLIALHELISAPDLLRQALFSTSAKASRAIRNESTPAGMPA